MRRLVISLVFALALLAPAAASAQPTFLFSGHGWGHAIGMAQWGSYGFAQQGWTFDRILAHYYPGTELGPAPTSVIRVLLASGRTSLEIASDSPFTVRDAAGFSAVLPAGVVRLRADLVLPGSKGRQLVPPVRFVPGTSPLRLGRPYRGQIVVSLAGGTLQAVNRLGLERYLYGVVPGEMPPGWHPEALKVQAVAARSYALASRRTGGSFDVFADTRSQVYGGLRAEDPRTNAAVNATRGQVVLYQGQVAWTYFSSSSGGRTAAIEDVWPGAEPVPYLVSVDDPYDTISPYHDWGPIAFTAQELEAKLGDRVPAGLADLQVEVNASGRAGTVTAVGAGGSTTTMSGWDLRVLLGLRSTWFRIDVVDLEPSARRVVYGKEVRLAGLARGVEQVLLEARPPGGAWRLLERVKPPKAGTFRVVHQPKVTTQYRLRLARLVGATARVAVAPRVLLRLAQGGRALAGSVEPGRAGSEVRIQRKSASGWKTVITVATGEDGRFRAKVDPAPGVYRAWAAPTNGLVAGTSAPLAVGGA